MKTIFISLFIAVLAANPGNEPSFPEVKGWTKSESIQVYEADNLWDYINGAAESYHAYDFEVLHVCDYTRADDEYITVEIYKHASPENAFGIYSAERPQEADFLEIGAEGYYEQGILNFIKSNIYIKLRASGESVEKDEIMHIAKTIANAVEGPDMLPKTLNFLPSENKIPHSTLFVGENFIGYSSLNDAYIADYKMNDIEFRVFVIARESEDILDESLKNYLARRSDLKQLPLNQIITIEDPYNGTIYLMKKGNYALGTINLNDKNIAESVLQ